MYPLITLNIAGTDHQVSAEGVALESYWDAYIIDVSPPQYRMRTDYGGYVEPSFGSLTVRFEPFASDWPPPMSIGVSISETDTTEAAAALLFAGKGHLRGLNRQGITYDLFGPSYTYEVPDATVFNDTLVNVVSWFCNAARLNLTLDSSAARASSPAVLHTTSGERLGIDLLSDISAFFGHLFYIEAGTLYLIDCLGYAGSRTLTEFDVLPARYEYLPPVAAVKNSGLDYQVVSAYPYGSENSPVGPFHTTQANVETAWTDTLTLLHRAQATISLPLAGALPKPGQRLILVDESMAQNVTATMYVRGLTYRFLESIVDCTCDGALA